MCEPPTANVRTMKVSEVTGDICSGIIFSHLRWVYKAGGQPSYLLCFQLSLLSYHNSFATVKINLAGFFLCLNLRASRKRSCTRTTRGDSLPLNCFMCPGRSCLLKSTAADCGLGDVFQRIEDEKWSKQQHQTSSKFSLTTSSCGLKASSLISQHGYAIPTREELRKLLRQIMGATLITESHDNFLLKVTFSVTLQHTFHNREVITNLSPGKGGKGVKGQQCWGLQSSRGAKSFTHSDLKQLLIQA